MSNLCQEITLPTVPISHIDDYLGEIALCILSAINVGKIKSDEELEELCDLSVRSLDEELIDYQDYPVSCCRDHNQGTSVFGYRFHWSGTLSWLSWVVSMIHKRHGMQFMDCLNPSSITC